MHVIDYLKKAVEEKASDIFFLAGSPATQKVDGHIVQLGEDNFYTLLFNHIVQCTCCPTAVCFPVFMHAIQNQCFIAAT